MRAAQHVHRPTSSVVKLLGSAVVLVGLGTMAWIATRTSLTAAPPQPQASVQISGIPAFDFTVTAERGYLRIGGTANFPNGVVLVGILDKIGDGVLEVKEALVMNRTFEIEFGPQLQAHYHLLGKVDALTAGSYRITFEFDQAHQSPFIRDLLLQGSRAGTSRVQGQGMREPDLAATRVAKIVTIGTAEERQQAQGIEQQYRQEIRQHLIDALGTLNGLWQRLRTEFQQQRAQGVFSRADPRAAAWRTWTEQWHREHRGAGETSRLFEPISPVSPHYYVRNTLAGLHKSLQTLVTLYFEALVNERPLDDRDLRGAERQVQLALGDLTAQLGQPSASPPVPKGEAAKATIVVSTGLANIRSGPGMSYDVVERAKKDDTLQLVGEKGEWFQVQLTDGPVGWIHRNVGSKNAVGAGSAPEAKRTDAKPISPERRATLQLDPLALQSTPLEFIPRPTEDEFRIYADVEQQLRNVPNREPEGRRTGEQRALQRVSEKYSISHELAWNAYLKVQGWEMKR